LILCAPGWEANNPEGLLKLELLNSGEAARELTGEEMLGIRASSKLKS
jgi:hypothetical protein